MDLVRLLKGRFKKSSTPSQATIAGSELNGITIFNTPDSIIKLPDDDYRIHEFIFDLDEILMNVKNKAEHDKLILKLIFDGLEIFTGRPVINGGCFLFASHNGTDLGQWPVKESSLEESVKLFLIDIVDYILKDYDSKVKELYDKKVTLRIGI